MKYHISSELWLQLQSGSRRKAGGSVEIVGATPAAKIRLCTNEKMKDYTDLQRIDYRAY